MNKVICFFGQAGSGKDTAANHLVKRLENGWKRIGFADEVKKVFMNSFNVTWEFIEEWKRKDEIPPGFDMPVRKALQQIGDGFRKIRADIWIDFAFRNKHNMAISDGRYLNEAKAVRERGGLNILLYRPGFENDDPNPSESQIKPYVEWCAKNVKQGYVDWGNHLTANLPDLKHFDCFLINDGNPEQMYTTIDKMISFTNL